METEQNQLETKLSGALTPIIDKHKDRILALLGGKSTDISCALLRNDSAVRTVATYCYALLPGLVRLAVKEDTFIAFVMTHRQTLLVKLVERQERQAATPAAPA